MLKYIIIKKDAAIIEVDTALKLFWEGGIYRENYCIAITLLAHSALEITEHLLGNTKDNKDDINSYIYQLQKRLELKNVTKSEFYDMYKEVFNFLKHAEDKDEKLEMFDKYNDNIIYATLNNIKLLFPEDGMNHRMLYFLDFFNQVRLNGNRDNLFLTYKAKVDSFKPTE